jgi:hypothetical protein
VGEPFVMPEVEVCLGAVVGDKDFAVLKGTERARIIIDVWVQLLDRHLEAACLKQCTDRSCSYTFPQR